MSLESNENNPIPQEPNEDSEKVTVNRAELMALINERNHYKSTCFVYAQDIQTLIINGKGLLGPFITKRPNPLTLVSEIMSKAGTLEQYVIPIAQLFEKYEGVVNQLPEPSQS